MQLLIQPQYHPMPVEDQVMQIYLAVKNYLMPVQVEEVSQFADGFIKFMHSNYPEVGESIKSTKELGKEQRFRKPSLNTLSSTALLTN